MITIARLWGRHFGPQAYRSLVVTVDDDGRIRIKAGSLDGVPNGQTAKMLNHSFGGMRLLVL
ncbi:MAG: hypothetical protein HYV60_08420 [Planctomycetia bacterium]|nr:hypothetical protein [Planctomycetia bacterium]